MITKLDHTTSENMIEKYMDLFDAAYSDLLANDKLSVEEERKGRFTNLAEYFAHSKDFLDIGKPKYLLLPLDESHFTIDANSRIIAVPTEFQSCSGVVSDNMAETITFLIDRYFDFIDLASLSIDVLWTAPGPDGKKIFGTDEISGDLVDLETFSAEGKLRFGWPLSAELTKNPGNIEFSVRFYYADAQKNYHYVLNTLPATIPIKNSLNIEKYGSDDVTVIRNHSNLFERFVRNYNGPVAGLPTVVSFSILDLTKEAKIDENDTLKLAACAYTPDQNILTYRWYKELNPSDPKSKAVVIDKDFISLDLDEDVEYSFIMPQIQDDNSLTLVNPSIGKPNLLEESSREAFQGAYILYDDKIYKTKIIEESEDVFALIGYETRVEINSNRQEIDPDDITGPFNIGMELQEVELTESEKQSRPIREFFYINNGVPTKYGKDLPWPPQVEEGGEMVPVKVYNYCPYLEFKPVTDATPENRLDDFNNITGKYFVTATNRRGSHETSGESTRTRIYEPANIDYTLKDLPDYVFIPQLENSGIITYETVALEAHLNHDDHNPDIAQICSYTASKEKEGFAPVQNENTVIEFADNNEKIVIRTTVPGYYKLNATSRLNRKTKNAESKICAVYNYPTTPIIDNCYYYVGNPNLNFDEIEWKAWDQGVEAFFKPNPETDEVNDTKWVYLKTVLSPTFTNDFSTREINYFWHLQKADEADQILTLDDARENGLVGKFFEESVDVDGKAMNAIALRWNWQGDNTDQEGSIKCEITNTIKDETSRKETKPIILV